MGRRIYRSPEEDLMVAVLANQLKDYLFRGSETAKCYIWADNKQSDNYVFGFNFICRFIEIDPERFKAKIKAMRERITKDHLTLHEYLDEFGFNND